MIDLSLGASLVTLCILLTLSGFLSASKTALVALNRYRLRSLANKQHPAALRTERLLQHSDELFGAIQIGNIVALVSAATIAIALAMRVWGETWLPLAAALLILMMIFFVLAPSALAKARPEAVALPATRMLLPLVKLLSPLARLASVCGSRLFGLEQDAKRHHQRIAGAELRDMIDESGDVLPGWHRQMLLNIFDLEHTTVEDIMLPRAQVAGLNLQDDIATLLKTIRSSEYTRLPIFDGDINNIVGVIHLRNVARFLHGADEAITRDAIRRFSEEPYFAPLGTPLHVQLMNFQKQKQRMAFVVDEYGDVQGLVTLEGLLEEIVGDFTARPVTAGEEDISVGNDGWYLIDASAPIREVNRRLDWDLPTGSAKTLNGLMMEYLQGIPAGNACCQIGEYRFKTCALSDKRIARAEVKRLRVRPSQAELF